MANRPSRIEISIPTASADGKFYGRYPKGNAPVGSGALAGAAIAGSVATGSLSTSGIVNLGVVTKGQVIMLTGAAFKAKSGNAPTVWDNGQDGVGPVSATRWNGSIQPFNAPSQYNLQNVANGTQISGSSVMQGPHANTTVFQAGNHYSKVDSNAGYQVGSTTTFTFGAGVAIPSYAYMHAYISQDANSYYAAFPFQVQLSGTLTSGSAVITGVTMIATINWSYLQPGDLISQFGASALRGTILSINQGAGTITMTAPYTGPAPGFYSTILTNNDNYDNNNKGVDICQGVGGYTGSPDGQHSYYVNGRNNTTINGATFAFPLSNAPAIFPTTILDDSSSCLQFPDANGHSATWNKGLNPGSGWRRVELLIRFAQDGTGFIRVLENNQFVASTGVGSLRNPNYLVDYLGPTVWSSPTSTTFSLGFTTYKRNRGPMPSTPDYAGAGTPGLYTQWDYQADQLIDVQNSGLGRCYATNSPTFQIGDGTVAEPQPQSGAIVAGVSYPVAFNPGALARGTIYLWFVDEANGVLQPQKLATGTY